MEKYIVAVVASLVMLVALPANSKTDEADQQFAKNTEAQLPLTKKAGR
jgi:hypothetical protein